MIARSVVEAAELFGRKRPIGQRQIEGIASVVR
jgi:hypothetical protein